MANVTEASIDIVLQQKDVKRLSRNRIFRIDRDELSNGAGILLQNLGKTCLLLLGTDYYLLFLIAWHSSLIIHYSPLLQ